MPSTPKFAISVELNALDKVSAVVSSATKNIRISFGNLKNMGNQIRMSDDFRAMKLSYNGMKDDATGAFTQMGKAAREYFSLVTGSTLAFGILGSMSYHKFREFSDATLSLDQASKRLGVAQSSLRGFYYAAEASGSSKEAISGALEKMNAHSFDFATGNLGAIEPLLALKGGFNFLDKSGKRKSADQLFLDAADRISKIRSPAIQAQMTGQIFGDMSLLPLISKGRSGIVELQSEIKNIGIAGAFDERAEKAALKFQVSLARITAYLREFRSVFGAEVLPGIADSIRKLGDLLLSKKEAIKNLFSDFGKNLPRELDSAIGWFSVLGNSLEWVSTHIGVVNALFAVFGVRIVFNALAGLWKLKDALIGLIAIIMNLGGALRTLSGLSALQMVFMAWPILIGIAVAAFVAGIYLIIKHWDFLKAKFLEGYHFIASKFESIGQTIRGGLGSLSTSLGITHTFENSPKDLLLEQILKASAGKEKQTSEVMIKIEGAPPGTRVTSVKGEVPTFIDTGYSTVGGY